jgi:hypothetical protein
MATRSLAIDHSASLTGSESQGLLDQNVFARRDGVEGDAGVVIRAHEDRVDAGVGHQIVAVDVHTRHSIALGQCTRCSLGEVAQRRDEVIG